MYSFIDFYSLIPHSVIHAGLHIVLPGYYSPRTMGLLDPATSDGRVIFFLPWESKEIQHTLTTSRSIAASLGHLLAVYKDSNRSV